MPNALDDVKKEETLIQESSPETPQEPEAPEVTPQAPATPEKPPKGFVPLNALQEERQKRQALEERQKTLEEELETLKSSIPSENEVFSDEGKILKSEISSLKSELSEVKTELTRKDLLINYPILKEKWEEFETFRSDSDNKGMNLKTAARAFLIENGLFDAPRKGLEKTTGGPRTPITSEMSAEDIDSLRKNDYKKYYSMLKKGQIRVGK